MADTWLRIVLVGIVLLLIAILVAVLPPGGLPGSLVAALLGALGVIVAVFGFVATAGQPRR
jgi:hypothetical protein